MRKIIIILILIFVTGCVSNEDFKKVCTYENKSNNLIDKTVMTIYYDGDDIVKDVSVVRNFKTDDVTILDSIKKASLIYVNRYGNKNISIFVSKNLNDEYELKYEFDARKVNENILNDFNIRKNKVKMFQRFKKIGIECEG